MGPTPNHANPSRTGGHGAVKDDDEETTVGTHAAAGIMPRVHDQKNGRRTTVDGRQDRGLGGCSYRPCTPELSAGAKVSVTSRPMPAQQMTGLHSVAVHEAVVSPEHPCG